jgi:fructose/tagatose bisphosphate aldolase
MFTWLAWRKKGIRLRAEMSQQSYQPEGPVIVVHSQAQAEAALAAAARADRPVVLASPPGAAAAMGAGYFRAMIAAARRAHPEARAVAVLDCGDRAGDAMGALREGIAVVCFRGDPAVAAKLAEMAAQMGAAVVSEVPDGLDLGAAAEPVSAVRAYLSD